MKTTQVSQVSFKACALGEAPESDNMSCSSGASAGTLVEFSLTRHCQHWSSLTPPPEAKPCPRQATLALSRKAAGRACPSCCPHCRATEQRQ